MFTLLTALVLANPLQPLLDGKVDKAADRVRAEGFEAVDRGLRDLDSTPHSSGGEYAIVHPAGDGPTPETADVHLVHLPDGRRLLVWVHGRIVDEPDHLGNPRHWAYDMYAAERTDGHWSRPARIGTSHMALQTFVDEAGQLHLFANGYNQGTQPTSLAVAPGKYQVHHSHLEGSTFTTWRPLLPQQPDLLHGWDVTDGGDGTLLFAWAPWFREAHYARSGQTVQVRTLRADELGTPRALEGMEGRNLTYPQFVTAGDETSLVASWQTGDYAKLGVAALDLDGAAPSELHEAVDFLRLHPEAGAPDELIWLGAGDGGSRDLHIGDRTLTLPPWSDSLGGSSVGVHGDVAAVAYDGGVYLLRDTKRGWRAQVLALPHPTGSGPFPRKFPGEPSVQVDGAHAEVAWWDAERGLVVWRGPIEPTGAWPEITWAASAGLGLGSGARAWLGSVLLERADTADEREATCLRQIVAVGLRELGGPGYRGGPVPAAVDPACFTSQDPAEPGVPAVRPRPRR